MDKVFLIVALLAPDGWIEGNRVEGWADRAQPSMDVCERRREFASRQALPDPFLRAVWRCVRRQ